MRSDNFSDRLARKQGSHLTPREGLPILECEIVRPVEVHVKGGSPEADLAHDTHSLCYLSYVYGQQIVSLQKIQSCGSCTSDI